MLRFTTAFVTNAAKRTPAAASTMLRGARTRPAVSFDRVRLDLPDLERTRALDITAGGGGGNFRVGTTPQTSTRNDRTLEERVAALRANLAAHKNHWYHVNAKLFEIAALKEENKLLEVEVSRLRAQKETSLHDHSAELEALPTFAQSIERPFDMLAEALKIVDEDFQRQFDTDYSLLSIWRTPDARCDEEANQASQGFLEASEPYLSRELRIPFFVAWESIRERCDERFPIPQEKVRKLKPHDLKAALALCCAEFANDVRASLFKVIVRSMEREGLRRPEA